ncbi:MAG: multiprotein-bridging factor 1 family protein [Promethearchaeia archaeon]
MPRGFFEEEEKKCPICDGVIWGGGEEIMIEGARIRVCSSCAQKGNKAPAKNKLKQQLRKKQRRTRSKRKTYKKSAKKKRRSRSNTLKNLEVVPNYAKKIRKVRNSKNLDQEKFAKKLNEKPSLIRRMEANRMKPTIQLAKKIQDTYNVRLLQKKDTNVNLTASQRKKFLKRGNGQSLGDIAFIKKKEKEEG